MIGGARDDIVTRAYTYTCETCGTEVEGGKGLTLVCQQEACDSMMVCSSAPEAW
jgi:hypothetical protein